MNNPTSRATVLGYPRQGSNRELKRAVEGYWAGRIDAAALTRTAAGLRRQRRRDLLAAGVGELPVGDFSLYDHVLDMTKMLGALPPRHVQAFADVSTAKGRLDRYFAAARGTADVEPMEMTKWFDTNYHYLVPEIGPDTDFALDSSVLLAEVDEAADAGVPLRAVVVGPVTFLALAKPAAGSPAGFRPLDRLDDVLPCYVQLLAELAGRDVGWVQLDEPILVTDVDPDLLRRAGEVYTALTGSANRPSVLVASYFDRIGDALQVLVQAGVDGFALDLTGPGAADLAAVTGGTLTGKRLVAGVVDGRAVWAADLRGALDKLVIVAGEVAQLDVSASCSLLHVPLDTELETGLDPTTRSWLAFAKQKLAEISALARGVNEGPTKATYALVRADGIRRSRLASPLVQVDAVRDRVAALTDADRRRTSAFAERRAAQRDRLPLPPLPTTTIGSFPQTTSLRKARADLRAGRLDRAGYVEQMRAEIRQVISEQEQLGLDVLVHGEPERNDMVQYFAEQLDGFLHTEQGWVQSYGSRYVRPPIVVGDISRRAAMTTDWIGYAQTLTSKPVKGMLTGPVTMLAWSFVRDDVDPSVSARQLALVLRDEIADLETQGAAVVQVDEPALRELLPLRRERRAAYLAWAVDAFRLATAGAADTTQVHTHMCYAEFGDVLQAIIDMDADVISLEAARSAMAIVEDLALAGYRNDVGPGVWDIHSPRVPSVAEMAAHLNLAATRLPVGQLWVNPDCGLKTRGEPEVRAALANLVAAAAQVRAG